MPAGCRSAKHDSRIFSSRRSQTKPRRRWWPFVDSRCFNGVERGFFRDLHDVQKPSEMQSHSVFATFTEKILHRERDSISRENRTSRTLRVRSHNQLIKLLKALTVIGQIPKLRQYKGDSDDAPKTCS